MHTRPPGNGLNVFTPHCTQVEPSMVYPGRQHLSTAKQACDITQVHHRLTHSDSQSCTRKRKRMRGVRSGILRHRSCVLHCLIYIHCVGVRCGVCGVFCHRNVPLLALKNCSALHRRMANLGPLLSSVQVLCIVAHRQVHTR